MYQYLSKLPGISLLDSEQLFNIELTLFTLRFITTTTNFLEVLNENTSNGTFNIHLILGQVENDNVYSTLVQHEGFHVDPKMVMRQIEWKHMEFSLICAVHL